MCDLRHPAFLKCLKYFNTRCQTDPHCLFIALKLWHALTTEPEARLGPGYSIKLREALRP